MGQMRCNDRATKTHNDKFDRRLAILNDNRRIRTQRRVEDAMIEVNWFWRLLVKPQIRCYQYGREGHTR